MAAFWSPLGTMWPREKTPRNMRRQGSSVFMIVKAYLPVTSFHALQRTAKELALFHRIETPGLMVKNIKYLPFPSPE